MDKHELDLLVTNTWRAMLQPLAELEVCEDCPPEYDLAACVDIAGNFHGSVCFECDEALAVAIAASMFSCTAEDVGPDEMLDALREIANLIGGNVKGLLAAGCVLSLPRATVGTEALMLNDHQQVLHESRYRSDGGGMRVRVLAEAAGEAA